MNVLETATALHKRGYPVILVGSDKNPGSIVGNNWQRFKWTPKKFRDLLEEHPTSQLGLRLGLTDCPVVDIEIDAEGAEQIEARIELDDLMAGTKTVSWESRRGPHFLFRLTGNQLEILRAKHAPAALKIGDIEVRLGGDDRAAQSLIAPSETDGFKREWGELSLVEHDPAPVPDRLFDAILGVLDRAAKERQGEGEAREDRPGDVYNQRADWSELLEPLGWEEVGDDGERKFWSRPKQPEKGKPAATTGFCSTERRPDMLHVFSTSPEIAPFEPNVSYTKFEAYALIHHEGDFEAATRDLGEQGYEYEPDLEELDDLPEETEPPAASAALTLPPPLSEEVFDNFIGRYVRAVAPHTEAHPDAIYLQMMELFGNFIGRGVYFERLEGPIYLNGYLCVVGPSGTGRKGTSLRVARRPFEELTAADHQVYIEQRTEFGLASGEGLIGALSDKNQITERRLMAVADEMATLIKKMRGDTSTLSAVLRTAFDGKTLSNQTKGDPAVATGAHVSLIMHTTPDEYHSLVNELDAKNGFLNRISFVAVEKLHDVVDSRPMDEDVLQTATKELEELYEWVYLVNFGKLRLQFDESAKEEWRRIYLQYEGRGAEGVNDTLLRRRPDYALKHACRFAVMDRSTVVTARHLCLAEALVEKSTESLRCLSSTRLYSEAKEIYAYIRDNKAVKRDQLRMHGRRLGVIQTSDDLDEILDGLLAEKRIRVVQEKKSGPGRPARLYTAT